MPKVGVHAIIVNPQNEVLLVRRNYLDHDWLLPGGKMEEGESIPEAAIREVLEETGYRIEVTNLIAVASRSSTNDVIIAVGGRIIEKQNHPIDPTEISEVGFFTFENLPAPMKPAVKSLLHQFREGNTGQLITLP